jgi:hypothetical protein
MPFLATIVDMVRVRGTWELVQLMETVIVRIWSL